MTFQPHLDPREIAGGEVLRLDPEVISPCIPPAPVHGIVTGNLEQEQILCGSRNSIRLQAVMIAAHAVRSVATQLPPVRLVCWQCVVRDQRASGWIDVHVSHEFTHGDGRIKPTATSMFAKFDGGLINSLADAIILPPNEIAIFKNSDEFIPVVLRKRGFWIVLAYRFDDGIYFCAQIILPRCLKRRTFLKIANDCIGIAHFLQPGRLPFSVIDPC